MRTYCPCLFEQVALKYFKYRQAQKYKLDPEMADEKSGASGVKITRAFQRAVVRLFRQQPYYFAVYFEAPPEAGGHFIAASFDSTDFKVKGNAAFINSTVIMYSLILRMIICTLAEQALW